MRKLLIIGANFPPTNAVDMHRIRTSLSYYSRYGWNPQVLCFEPSSADHPIDETLENSITNEVKVYRVNCPRNGWQSKIGLNAAGYRGYWRMRRAGIEAIRAEKPDLIFFSTTSFPLMRLGPSFKRMFGVPYILDFQDPWISEDASIHPRQMKHFLVRRLHRILEPRAVLHAAGLMSVSPDYIGVLRRRYQLPDRLPTEVIPFGASAEDIQIARRIAREREQHWPSGLRQDLHNSVTGVYAGAYVKSMEPMVRALFRGVQVLLNQSPIWNDRLRLWFIGSHYTSSVDTCPIVAIAAEYGLSSIVREHPQRIPYFDALGIICQASFILALGSTSRAYNPSKLLTYLQSATPLFAVVQRETYADELLSKAGGCVVQYASLDNADSPPSSQLSQFVHSLSTGAINLPQVNRGFVDQFTAESLTARQSTLFDNALDYSRNCTGTSVSSCG